MRHLQPHKEYIFSPSIKRGDDLAMSVCLFQCKLVFLSFRPILMKRGTHAPYFCMLYKSRNERIDFVIFKYITNLTHRLLVMLVSILPNIIKKSDHYNI